MTIKQTTLMTLLQKDFTTVHVAFRADIKEAQKPQNVQIWEAPAGKPKTPRLFTYKAAYSENVKVDDYVVVEGPNGGPMVALVFRVDETPQIDVDADFEYRWIVQKIDRAPYEARVAKEKEFLEAMRIVEAEHQRQELVQKMMDHLPADSEARKRFDAAVAGLTGTPQLDAPQ